MDYTDSNEVFFGFIDGKDEFGFSNGYVNQKWGIFCSQSAFSQDQKDRIYEAMRQQRLKGVNLNPIQPLPNFLYEFSDEGQSGLAYRLAKDFSKWDNYAKKSTEIRNIYCVTNKELICNSPEIIEYFSKKAQEIVKKAGKHKEQIDIDALKQIKNILDDVNLIYKAIGHDKICTLLSTVYDRHYGITASELLNSINNYKFNTAEEETSEENAK